MHLLHQIGDRELQLVRPQLPVFGLRREAVPPAEVEQNVRGLRDDELPSLEEWRSERRILLARTGHHCEQPLLAASLARDIDKVRTDILQRQPDEFTPALDVRPVIELVAHGPSLPVFCTSCRTSWRQVRLAELGYARSNGNNSVRQHSKTMGGDKSRCRGCP
jgi:hypothetical protein